MNERIDTLEAKVALAEDLLETLNHVVFRQQEQIDLLQQQIRTLAQQLRATPTGAEPRNLRDEIPPHY